MAHNTEFLGNFSLPFNSIKVAFLTGDSLALSIEADGDRHQLGRHRPVGGTCQHIFDVHTEAARRSEMGNRSIGIDQPLFGQALGERGGKGLAQFLQCLGRQLFDEEFNEEALRAHAASFFASMACTSSAHARGAIGKPSRARLSR